MSEILRYTPKRLAKIREAAARSGFSDADIARRAGISRPSISLILAGKRAPRRQAAYNLALVLGLDPDDLKADNINPKKADQ